MAAGGAAMADAHAPMYEPETGPPARHEDLHGEARVTDSVCGMQVDPRTAAARATHEGRDFFFCSPSCRDKFVANPAQYAGPSNARPDRVPATSVPSGTPYTCPMHPDVRQDGPGTCPICGMALEPVTPGGKIFKTEYTCPMHPEIVRSAPGFCPICGMALEPRTVTLEEEENL